MQPFSPEWMMIFYIANNVLSAFIQSLPPITTSSGPLYVFFNKFMSLLIADFKTFSAKPQLPATTQTTGEVVATTTVDNKQQVSVPAPVTNSSPQNTSIPGVL